MEKRMRKSLVAIAVVVVLGSIITFCIVVQNKDKKDMVLPPEIVQASKEFKENNTPPESLSRDHVAEKLAPYVKKGMSKEQVRDLLGDLPPAMSSGNKWHYSNITFNIY